MATAGAIIWDKTGEHFYETGVSKGVLYEQTGSGTYTNGVGWNGLSSVTESPSGGDTTATYANNSKYLSLVAAEDFGFTIEAYTWPDEWGIHDGSASPTTGITIGQQKRQPFGFCYRTEVGNDTQGDSFGYKLHLIYGATAAPSSKDYATESDSPEVNPFSWECSTVPVNVVVYDTEDTNEYKPTAILTIDSTKLTSSQKTNLGKLEEILYGKDAVTGTSASDATIPKLPLPGEVIYFIDHGTLPTNSPSNPS